MTDDVIGAGTHQQLITLLTEQGARFRVMEHEAAKGLPRQPGRGRYPDRLRFRRDPAL